MCRRRAPRPCLDLSCRACCAACQLCLTSQPTTLSWLACLLTAPATALPCAARPCSAGGRARGEDGGGGAAARVQPPAGASCAPLLRVGVAPLLPPRAAGARVGARVVPCWRRLSAELQPVPHPRPLLYRLLAVPSPVPQVLVDLFVNYDCSLQAANLYERSIKAIRKLMALPEGAAAPFAPAAMEVRVSGRASAACRTCLRRWAACPWLV